MVFWRDRTEAGALSFATSFNARRLAGRQDGRSVLCGLLSGVLPTLIIQPALAGAPSDHLATADQTRVEAVALQVLDTAEVRAAQQQARDLFRADPIAATSAGRATLEEAVNETVFAAVVDTVADDPAHPALIWVLNAPHKWHGLEVPGSRYGIDNPDNIYRLTFIDPHARYEIKGLKASNGPAQFVFELLDSAPGIEGTGKQLGILKDTDIQTAPDGSFTITIGPETAAGKPNHIQTQPDAKAILIRDTLGDWSKQVPNQLRIQRLTATDAPSPEIHQLALKAAEIIPNFASYILDFRNHALIQKSFHRQINKLETADARQGNWGYAAGAQYKLQPDEALLVRVVPSGAGYLGFQLANPWMISADYIHRSGSLNNHQAVPNGDGSYSYVISAEDPGVGNWLDTGGLNEGFFQLRWQQLAAGASVEDAIREVRLVKRTDLPGLLPGSSVTPQTRKKQLAARAQAYQRRLEE